MAEQLAAWHDFYVIVGSAAAGLTGLMFVVVSLGTWTARSRSHPGFRAFVTPTVVFFASVLVTAAFLTVPWTRVEPVAAGLGAGSLAEIVYLLVIRGHRQWRQSKLDRLDWFWYVGFPIATYAFGTVAAATSLVRPALGLELIGAVLVLLLVIGIRNAWDLVIWTTQQRSDQGSE